MRFKEYLTENEIVHSCGFVIIHNGKFLIGHASRNQWSSKFWGIPKGMVDQGETKLQAGIREVLEETGLDLKKIKGQVAEIGQAKYKAFKGRQKILTGFVFVTDEDLTKKKLVCDSFVELPDGDTFPEIDKFHWMELGKDKAHPTTVELSKKAMTMIDDNKLKEGVKEIKL